MIIRTYLVLTLFTFLTTSQLFAADHPLRPLTDKELKEVVTIIKKDSRYKAGSHFTWVQLVEPAKDRVLKGDRSPREVRVLLLEPRNVVMDVIVDLGDRSMSWTKLDAGQPPLQAAERDSAVAIVLRNPTMKKALERRKVDPKDVHFDVWASGIPSGGRSARLVKVVPYYKINGVARYDRPLDGVEALVNITGRFAMLVYDRAKGPESRTAEPLDKTEDLALQGSTKNIRMVDGELRWKNWSLRPALHAREGLTVHDLRLRVNGSPHRVAWRVNVSEVLTTIADSSAMWAWRQPLDIGELGAQLMLRPLRKGSDVPRTALFTPASFVSDTGALRTVKDAWAAYESEGRLVLASRLEANNRQYVVRYAFESNGSFHASVDVGGWTLVKVTDDSVQSPESHDQERVRFIAPYLLAPIVQHAVCVRADLDVDTTINAVDEIDVVSDDDTTANRQGNVARVDITELRFEREAQRDADVARMRRWRVRSVAEPSTAGMTPGYEIVSTDAGRSLLTERNYNHRRARFIDHHMQVTRYHDAELHVAGDLVNQSQEGKGLPEFQANNESVRNTDVVTWITVMVHEAPRPEDVPLMRTQRCGVSFLPSGFVERR